MLVEYHWQGYGMLRCRLMIEHGLLDDSKPRAEKSCNTRSRVERVPALTHDARLFFNTVYNNTYKHTYV